MPPPTTSLDTQFRAIAECSLDAVTRMECVRDEAGAIVDFVYTGTNERGARLLSQPGDTLRGRRFRELFPSPEAVAHVGRLASVVETGEALEYELRIRDPGVRAEWVMLRVVRFGDGVLNTSRDISDRKRALEVLELHSTIVRNMSDGVCLGRVSDGVIIYANPRFAQIHGYEPGELDGRNISVIKAPGWDSGPIIATLQARGEATYEVENLKKDGTRITCHATTTMIEHPEHGSVWVAVREDITDRKRIEAERRRDEVALRHLAAIIESSSDAIISSTPDGRVDTWNLGAERLYGYSRDEVVGRPVSMFVPPGHEGEFDDVLLRIKRGEVMEPRETERLHKDGTLREVSVSFSPIRRADGTLLGNSTISRDISASKAAERQLTASLREKEVLLQEVHHRVKNNLQVIVSLLKLQAGRVVDAQARAVFEESQSRVRSIALLHEKLYQSKDFAHVDLSDYGHGLVQSLLRMYGTLGDRVDVTISATDVLLGLDAAVPCGLIINELVTNAFKHAFPPSLAGRGRIVIEAARRDDEVVVVVSDNGAGLSEGFDFAQARTLGMHLVRTLARQLGGTATFEGGSGTRCTISFTDVRHGRDATRT